MFTILPNGIFNASGMCNKNTTLSWNKRTDCCSWNGIHCDETDGTTKFGELSSLMHLNLMYSSFTGVIPTEISHLSKLQVLSISIDNSYRLRLEPYNFELLLKNLTQLRDLELDDVNVSSSIPLNFFSYLTTLRLPHTVLHGVLPERVFHLSNLEYLYLPYNSLTGPIPSNVGGLQNLRYLYLTSNYLNGTIPSWIFSLTSLSGLDLSNNSFSGKIHVFKSKALNGVF
ncbi:hypothetical protein CQW23_35441 [Capsicum baccatum]|uniref:Leucine-rich repeat-containing N-terminal plant-type domain-containing protein n=1 Tax=Capsicum baccatum TaxID=33114 RepID=A0A2G2UVX8_CAPBA|nr:hypothetical protein CQW23_35441 [Capsicum baccatum]